MVFRNKHLQAWRDVVELSEPDAIDTNLTKRVEADVLQHMGEAAPLKGVEFQALLALSTAEEIRACLAAFRSISTADRKYLLDHVVNAAVGEGISKGEAGER